jgi:hypothetical protein
MLADTAYAETEKDRPNVERRLDEAGWSAQVCTQLKALALRWASKQGTDVHASLRKALGETITEEEAAMLPSRARLESTHSTITTTLEGVAAMSIAYDESSTIVVPKDSPMTELYGEPDWTELERQARLMERDPWDYSPERIAKAVSAIKAGHVSLGVPASSVAYVQSNREAKRRYTVRDGRCSCQATHPCYHTAAVEIYRLWQDKLAAPSLFPQEKTVEERLAETPPQTPQDAPGDAIALQDDSQDAPTPLAPPHDQKEGIPVPTLETPPPAVPLPRRRPKVPAEYIDVIKGKRHVQFAGLVAMAQEDGLASLAADWTYNDAELSLAHAVATFQDGRRYEESGDATPSNVTPMVKPHFRRVALTRAKARCLRDALGIEECAVEEVEDEADKRPVPTMSPGPPVAPAVDARVVIRNLLTARGEQCRTKAEYEAAVWAHTGLTLEAANFAAIIAKLQQRARATAREE